MRTGRPRDPLVTQRALAATWDLLSTKGYSALRIDDIATSCGIAKTTLYRRWPSLAHIVVDAVVSRIGDRTFTPTDDPVADLRAVSSMLVQSVNAGKDSWVSIALSLHEQSESELPLRYRERIIDPVRELLAEVLERTALAGCLATTIPTDQLADMLIGGTVYRLVFLHSPLTEDEVTTIIGGLLTAR